MRLSPSQARITALSLEKNHHFRRNW